MRDVENPQPQFGQVAIADIVLDPKSRDDIPQLLRGLQYIYTTPELRAEVFEILRQLIPLNAEGKPVSADNGRPGMSQWTILVLGVLRLGINTDFDRLHELANQHKTVRQFLGHSGWADTTEYSLAQLQINLRLFTPEILDQINQAVVRQGHALVKKSPSAGPTAPELLVRCDSFVVETHVHYPTDINLLWDAVRKILNDGCTNTLCSYMASNWPRPWGYPAGAKLCTTSAYSSASIVRYSNYAAAPRPKSNGWNMKPSVC